MVKVVSDLKQYWAERIGRYGDTHEALGWSSKERQIKRFEVLSKIVGQSGSVLDVGCGTGDLYLYLQNKGWRGKYVGIDISEEMLLAAKKKLPGLTFLCHDMFNPVTFGSFSYVLLSGALNLRMSESDYVQYKWMEIVVGNMWAAAKKAVSFNVRSSWGFEPLSEEIFAFDPAIVLAFCKKLTSNLMLDHTYFPHDFTVFLFKAKWKTFSN
jgi:SAM-dependent methyltransferase